MAIQKGNKWNYADYVIQMKKICGDPLEDSDVVIKPVFVIEVKKEDEMIGELRPHLAQNLKQMRHMCI